MGKPIEAWWFEDGSHKLPNGDGREVKAGITHEVEGNIIPCEHGLHGSKRIFDALTYATGNYVWQVELSGTIEEHANDKIAASKRKYIRGCDIEDVLRVFARRVALDVIHLWDAPQVVRDYLTTGSKSLRASAWAAAGAAAEAAGAARASAWDAAWSAARAAAGDAACAAEGAAEGAAAMEKYNLWLEEMVREKQGVKP